MSKEAPNLHILKLTFLFFATGLAGFLAAMLAALRFVPELALAHSLRSPHGWAMAHLLVLGWATMVAMGASYQITQIVMRTSLYSRAVGYAHYSCFAGGLIVLVAGLLTRGDWIVYGGVLLTVGVLLYVFNLTMTFIRQKEWNLFVLGVSLSLLQFLITIALGIVMGVGMACGGTSRYEAVFATHFRVGIAGWLSGLTLVYSFKLLPMFLVSRRKLTHTAYWMLGLYHACIWLQAAPLWGAPDWIGQAATLGMAAVLGWFVLTVWSIYTERNRKHPAGTIAIALLLIPAMYALFLIWACLREFGGLPGAGEALIMALILLWFTGSILSYLSRILPFLWWAQRYRTKEEKKNAVLLSAMLPEARMKWELAGYLAREAGAIGGILLHAPQMALVGQEVTARACPDGFLRK